MAYEGTRLGDITLCAVCDFAIQLRRAHITAMRAEVDVWEHFRVPINPHPAKPKRSLWDCPVGRETERSDMSYEWEYDEWRAAAAELSETDRAATEYDVRRSAGLSGDADDVRYTGGE
jgi:hypothetical protein